MGVDYYIEKLEGDKKAIVLLLRDIILDIVPNVQEKISYGIPFYYHLGRLCYINVRKKEVDLGFCFGYLMQDHPLLLIKDRKEIKTISFKSVSEIDIDLLRTFLFEAVSLNQGKKSKTKY